MNKFAFLKEVAAISHGKVNISGGNVFQHEIYLAIKESGKHNEVYEECKIPLIEGKRKIHKVDILIIDDDIVITINMNKKRYTRKKYKKRNKLERWIDKYNHTLELVRTITGLTLLILQLLVLYKLFN